MSKKFTGITSAGSAIPVYDKDAHSALEQKLDTSAFSSVSGSFLTSGDLDGYATEGFVESAVSGKADTSAIPSLDGYATEQWVGEQGYLTEVPESAVSGYATHEEVVSSTSGKLDASAVKYGWKPDDTKIVTGISGYGISASEISPDASALKELNYVPIVSAYNTYSPGVSASPHNGLTLYNSGGLSDSFTVSSVFSNSARPGFFRVNGWGYNYEQSIILRDGVSGIDRIKISAGLGNFNPSITLRGAVDANNNGVFIDVSGASAVDRNGNVTWQVGGPASQLFNGSLDKKPAILLVSLPTADQYSASWSSAPYLSADNQSLTMSYGSTASTPNIRISPIGFNANYTSSHASYTTADATVSRYSAANDPNRIDWSLTGSVQKREIECDSATSAITAIAGSAIGGKEYSAGANIDITDEVISGKDWSDEIISATSGLQPSGDYYSASNPSGFISTVPDTYLQNTDLTIVDNKVTEISGVPLSAGDELPSGTMNTSGLEYNAVNEISGYNGSAIAQYGAEKQWLQHDDTLVHAANSAQYALGVNLSAVAQLLGVDETVLYSAGNQQITTYQLSELPSNFKEIGIYWKGNAIDGGNHLTRYDRIDTNLLADTYVFPGSFWSTGDTFYNCIAFVSGMRTTNWNRWKCGFGALGATAYDYSRDWWMYITKIVGIGRKQ